MEHDHTNNPLHKGRNEDTGSLSQRQIVYNYLKTHTATNAMTSAATGVPRENLCRIKRQLEKAGLLWEVERKRCLCTKHRAWYLTTNRDNAPLPKIQLHLF